MPPEQSPPWDRKEFFRERKHERSETLGGSAARWRDLPHHPSRDFNRWGSSDFRRPVGHGKQNSWHFFPEESHHGYSRERVMEDENFRPFPRGEGRYNRNNNYNRDNSRGSFNNNLREWRGHSWETNNGFSNTPIRTHEVISEPKPHGEAPPHQSLPNNNNSNNGFGQTWDQIRPREQHNNNGKTNGKDGTELSDWKPIKCLRSGSLSSRGSVLVNLGGSKSVLAMDPSEQKVERVMTRNESPIRSPSGDANNASALCASGFLEEESCSRKKKPRLGWGEGLAKYEKKKVDGPEVTTSSKEGAVSGSGNVESPNLVGSSMADNRSPKVASFLDCAASPATPSSVACSSSPGLEDKSFGKAANTDHDTSNLCISPEPVSQDHSEVSFNLESLDFNSVADISAVLLELLQSDDRNTTASSFMRGTAMNKVLMVKGEISKNLEVTESEIDQLECELKFLNSAIRGSSPSASSSLPPEDNAKSCNEQGVVANPIPRPAPLQIVSSAEAVQEKLPICNRGQEENFTSHKDVDVDSPGTVTSKLVEPLSLAKVVSSASGDSKDCLVTNKGVRDSAHGFGVGKIGSSSVRDDNIILSEGEKTDSVSNVVVLLPGYEKSHDVIYSTNRQVAAGSWEVFNKLLPRGEYEFKAVSVDKASENNLSVKERFVKRKRFSKLKLRVITFKFKALQYIWKEDMRLLSIGKHRAKSQKKFELNLRPLHNGYQKHHRSSIRSRFFSPGSISLVPTTEVLDFISQRMLDSQIKLYRDTLKMPALIIDKKEKSYSRFISNNGLVEDPCAVERGRSVINPWTPAEKDIFMEKFALLGKDFKTIATFLNHKTTADCVEFYYKNHKTNCFEKRKKLDVAGGKQEASNFLMTMGQKWNRERNTASLDILGMASMTVGQKWNQERSAASLDILGTASMIAANADNCNTRSRQGYSRRLILGGSSKSRASWIGDVTAERSGSFGMVGNDRDAAAADVLAGISLSSEAMSSCITSSADPGESYHRPWKSQRLSSVFRPDVTHNVDEETCSDESCGELMGSNDWTDEEKSVFIQAVSLHGKDFSKISRCVRTRSRDQCKVFFSKVRKCLGLDQIRPVPGGNERKSAKDDTNGSGSGSENAYAREVGSGVVPKMDGVPISSVKVEQEGSKHAETVHSQPEVKVKIEAELIGANGRSVVGGGSERETEPRPNAVSDGDSNIVNGIDDHSEIVPVNESESSLVCSSSAVTKTVTELLSSCEGNDDMERPESGTTVGASSKPVDEEGLLDGLSTKPKEIEEENGNSIPTTSGQSGSTMNLAGSNGSSCSGSSPNGGRHLNCPVPLELCLKETNLVSVDSCPMLSEEKGMEDKLSSSDSGHVKVLKDESQLILTGLPLLTNSESSSSQVVPSSFQPSRISIQRELNGENRCNRNVSSPDALYTSQAYYLQKCSGLRPQPPPPQCSVVVPDFPLVAQNVERSLENLRLSQSQSLSDSENSCRSGSGGDVKLFGKILSNPSSTVQKPDPVHKQEKEGCRIRFGPSSYVGIENVQMSYSYWDHLNRFPGSVGTFASIPESARLLAKYPAAFSNFAATTPASKIDQQTVFKAVGGERGVNGVVFPARDISGEGYQLFGGGGGGSVVVPPVLGSLQHHTGRGVSDPVAALKLHFAKAEQFGGTGNGGGVTRDERET